MIECAKIIIFLNLGKIMREVKDCERRRGKKDDEKGVMCIELERVRKRKAWEEYIMERGKGDEVCLLLLA
ncbi:MAG: hypothetical protein ACTTJY_03055 [Hoylesella shahii]|jgi:hypothetical protein|uniref:hypothetical protein n=1 Tax=Hoylesella shahii TaxID=228603 RepID=UPI003FA0AF18